MVPYPDSRFLGSFLFKKLTKHKSLTNSIFSGVMRSLIKLVQLLQFLGLKNKEKRLEEMIISVRVE